MVRGMKPCRTKLNVGVTILLRKGAQSFWENGIFQNCYFLSQLLTRCDELGEVYLVAVGEGGQEEMQQFLRNAPVPVIRLEDAHDALDAIVEMSVGLPPEWVNPFREKGGKVISYSVGNDLIIDMERLCYQLPNAWLVPDSPRDAVWTLEEYRNTGKPYYQTLLRAPVRIMPHLWCEDMLEAALESEPSLCGRFGYRTMQERGQARWRATIMEPNVSSVKTSFIPLFICEALHRKQPQLLEHVYALNTQQLMEHAVFAGIMRDLDITQHGLVSFEGRHPSYQVFTDYTDVLVTHQQENAQNYLYYEALYGGYPLVHNSHLLGDCGYRYHGFDCEEGADALLHAFENHDANIADYRKRSADFLATLRPDYADNIAIYTQSILALFE